MKWQSRPLEECIERVKYEAKIPRSKFLEAGLFPIVSQEADFINGYWDQKSDLFKSDRPVVVFGDHTQVLKYVDFDFVIGADGVKVLKPKRFLEAKYFYYFLQAVRLKRLGYARHYRLLAKIPVIYPALCEQKRIVVILDEVFQGIDTAVNSAEKNLASAAKLLWAAREKEFKKLLENTTPVPLGSICEFENGDRGKNYPGKEHRTLSGIPFINAGHLTYDGIDHSSMDFISRERFNLLGNGKIKPDDILFCLRGSLGKFASVGDLDEGAIASSLVIIRPKSQLTSNYLLAYLASDLCTNMVDKFKGGAAQPNLGAKDLRRFEVPLPLIEEQERVSKRLQMIQLEVRRLENNYRRKLSILSELKQAILQKAFTGGLTEQSAEAVQEAAE